MNLKISAFPIFSILASPKSVTSFSLINNRHRKQAQSIRPYKCTIQPTTTHTFCNNLGRTLNLFSTLTPAENPHYVDSVSDIQSELYPHTSFKSVLQGLHQLYPPNDLEQRNSKSRTDGYWAYISNGESPPAHYTYGEFDFYFFADLLDRAHTHYKQYNQENVNQANELGWQDKVFCDIGSGTGRLVMAAAALHPGWKLCRGVELLEGIHKEALETLEKCQIDVANDYHEYYDKTTQQSDFEYQLPLPSLTNTHGNINHFATQSTVLAPIQYTQGSFTDPYLHLSNIDIAFVFSSCFDSDIMNSLSKALGRQCREGSIIITTDYPLVLQGTCDAEKDDPCMPIGEYEFEIVDQIDGYCWLVGGITTAYIHVVKKSLHDKYGKQERMKSFNLLYR